LERQTKGRTEEGGSHSVLAALVVLTIEMLMSAGGDHEVFKKARIVNVRCDHDVVVIDAGAVPLKWRRWK
jgi:hypothetical protein